jgi:glycosyltransferase involved in cell wall biosynthesis
VDNAPVGTNLGPPARRFRALLYGLLLIGIGFAIYVGAVVLAALRHLIPGDFLTTLLHDVIWYTGMPVFAGLRLCALDLFVLLRRRPKRDYVAFEAPDIKQLTVVLTAYNDELSIPAAVRDFASHPLVRRVIVLDNNSGDRTAKFAGEAGAEVIIEERPGYGRCVYRALSEGMKFEDTELTLLCEGDMTFRSYDIDKFMAYIAHAEIVNGTRIVEQLRERDTQLTTFMYYGNFFAAKVLEAKHLGEGTFTDVGTTYKLCRNRILKRLLPVIDPSVNLEFNAHFLDTALSYGVRMVECPVTFHQRVGRSKGGNTGNWRAFTVGIRMLTGIILSWKYVTRNK